MNTTQYDVFSLWRIFSEAGLLINFFSYLIFVIVIFAVYIFFEKFLFLKKQTKSSNQLLDNLNDFIHEGRLDAALDYCERENFPQARVIKPGIERIGRPIQEISTVMRFQRNFEINHFQKNIPLILFLAKLVLLIGILGTSVALFFSFYDASKIAEKTTDSYLYFRIFQSLLPVITGIVSAIILYFLHHILVKNLLVLKSKIAKTEANFINILNKP